MKYKSGYKYQIVEDLRIQTRIIGFAADTDFIRLYADGLLVVKKGYAFDGPTGIPDFKAAMRGSAGHDALYQLIRLGLLPASCKTAADKTLCDICYTDFLEIHKRFPFKDQLATAFANTILWGVDKTGWLGLGPEREILTAP